METSKHMNESEKSMTLVDVLSINNFLLYCAIIFASETGCQSIHFFFLTVVIFS